MSTFAWQIHKQGPDYAPYCMRCSGMHRMRKVGDYYWRHSCGAEHDDRGKRAEYESELKRLRELAEQEAQ